MAALTRKLVADAGAKALRSFSTSANACNDWFGHVEAAPKVCARRRKPSAPSYSERGLGSELTCAWMLYRIRFWVSRRTS
jgi:hypothetical protein